MKIVAWNKLAEYATEKLRKGTPLFVTGRLQSYSWRDEEENPRSLVEVQVRGLQLLEKTQDRSNGITEIDTDEEELAEEA